MERLKETIKLKGLGMAVKATLVKRTVRKAIYLRDDGYYEVFKILVAPEGNVFGKHYPERELYPNNEDFGYTAWCIKDKQRALDRYSKL